MELGESSNKPTIVFNHYFDGADEDPPTLSSQTLEALTEFLAEQNRTLAEASASETATDSKVDLVAEDWRLSQFWYDHQTAQTLSEEVFTIHTEVSGCRVACVACPTIYAYLKKNDPNVPVQLLEYDKRFEQYGGDFTFYDYKQPEELPSELKNVHQIVIVDPPYLSEECLQKVARTVAFLAKPGKFYLLLLTGEVQQERAAKLLGLHPCNFRPLHSSKLGNEFRLFTNYDPGERLGGWDKRAIH